LGLGLDAHGVRVGVGDRKLTQAEGGRLLRRVPGQGEGEGEGEVEGWG
jgi:hypothetical protein